MSLKIGKLHHSNYAVVEQLNFVIIKKAKAREEGNKTKIPLVISFYSPII
jgi:hypothetical protein